MKNLFSYLLLIAVVILSTTSCETRRVNNTKDEAIENYTTLVLNNYNAAYADAVTMKSALNAFTANPSEGTLTAAKNAWFQARETYGITEVFRFQDGPIDLIGSNEGPEGLLNAWPLDESHIDYVDGNATSGIVNDASITIDKATLEGKNGVPEEENVAIGYHAIEFLLWGQDLTAPSAKQPGQRVYTDFVDGGTADNQDRRRQYLDVCADLVLDHLQLVIDEWKDGGAYRDEFLNFDTDVAMSKIMTGMAALARTELSGERIFTAYDNEDQEDEHSCFSDNTHRDTRLNFQGIKNVYLGLIDGSENTSVHDVIAAKDQELADSVKEALTAAETAVNGTAIPFDFAITDATERPKVLTAVQALRTLGDRLVEAGSALDIEVGIE